MNSTSEWTKFFDARKGRYRFKHKGSGIVRDTLKHIGRAFGKSASKTAKVAVEKAAAAAGEKLAKTAAEKKGEQNPGGVGKKKKTSPAWKTRPQSERETMMKLARLLAN